MKINYIKTKNINSLVGENLIDFRQSPLSDAGLFAIVGPTGSGKSTLLDAICLALFNRVPRLDNAISKTLIAESGSIITRNCRDAMAEVGYTCRKGEFVSQWSIAYNRNDNLNDYHMQLQDVAANALVDLKRGQVPKQNEDNIGLNFDQFVKSMVLAQGEFAKFLKSKKSERSEMLERITGSSIYRQLGIKAFEYGREVEQKRQRLEEQIAEVEVLPEEEFATLQQTLVTTNQALATLGEHQKRLEEITKDFQHHEKAKADFLAIENKLEVSKAALEEFQNIHAQRMQQHEELLPYLDDMRAHAEKERAHQELQKEVQEMLKTQHQLGLQRAKIFADIKKFLAQPECLESDMELSLEEIRRKYNALKGKIDAKIELYKGIEQGIDFSTIGWKTVAKKDQTLIAQLEAELTETDEKIASLSNNPGLVAFQEVLDNDLEELLETLRWKEEALRKVKSLEEISTAKAIFIGEQMKLQEEGSTAFSQVETALAEAEQLLALEQKKYQLKLEIASLQERRHQLTDGQPCPLCGALHHPYAHDEPPTDDSAQQPIEALQSEINTLTKQRNSLQTASVKVATTIENENKRMEEIKAEITEITESLKVSSSRIPLPLQPFSYDALKDVAALRKQLTASEERKQNLEKVLQKCRELLIISLEGEQMRKELTSIYSGDDFEKVIQGYLRDWQGVNGDIKSTMHQLEVAEEKLNRRIAEMGVLEKALLPNLHQLGHDDISSAQRSIMPVAAYQKLVAELDAIRKTIDTRKGAYENQKQILASFKERLEAVDIAAVRKSQAENCQKMEQLHVERDQTIIAINGQEQAQLKLLQLNASLTDLLKTGKKWLLLRTLIGDREGKKFNDFAQQLNLQQLIFASNKRLKELSRRYVLATSDEEKNEDLLIYDMEMGGIPRSVQTLSGGETFQLSLALALGLADMASQQVDIRSLFIDEGFGTLDPETLHTTIDMLEQLQMESQKTIGMITHVEALRERIRVKINIEKDGNGYSTVMVMED